MKHRGIKVKALKHHPDKTSEIELIATKEAELAVIRRITLLAIAFAGGHLLFALGSYPIISKFDQNVPFWLNFISRVLLCSAPFAALAVFLRKGTAQPRSKMITFIWIHSALFSVAACIYVWPIALTKNAEIILYVSSANAVYLLPTYIMGALPTKLLTHAIPAAILLILGPLLVVGYFSGGSEFAVLIANDISLPFIVGIVCGNLHWKHHRRYELLRAEQIYESSRFFEAPVVKAIFEGNKELLEQKQVPCIVVNMDIRNSTRMSQQHQEKWQLFVEDWFAAATDIVHRHEQSVIKTTGDGLLLAFGLFDEVPDLSDLPGVEDQVAQADEIRWQDLTQTTMNCLEELYMKFFEVSGDHFPGSILRIGAGVDRGTVMRGVRGSKHRVEFDVWGDPVNICSKIESYSKQIPGLSPEKCALVLSPYACDFLEDLKSWRKVNVEDSSLASDMGIKWVLVKEFANPVADRSSKAS